MKLSNFCVVSIIAIIIFVLLFYLSPNYNVEEGFVKLVELKPPQVKSTQLFDINLKYVLESKICNNSSDILAIIIVTSYFGNVETRSAMRRAFSSSDLSKNRIKRIFLLGLATNAEALTTQEAIMDESKRFGDIIQGNFVEAYRNLTYKHLMGLTWTSENCNQAKFVIKMDDDIVANFHKIPDLLRNFTTINKFSNNNLLAGYVLRGMTPIREPLNKWFVTKKEYQYSMYPPFLSGWFYISTPKVCKKVVDLSRKTRYFWIDDVYVSGILALKLRIKLFDIGKYFAVDPKGLQCCMEQAEVNSDCDILIGPNGGDNNLFYTFNKVMENCGGGKCKKLDNEICKFKANNSLIGKGNAIIKNYKMR